MKKINACCLKLFLDKINNYEEGIVDIVKSIMDLNLLFFNHYKIRLDIDSDFFVIYYFDLKEQIQMNFTLKYIEHKKIIKIDERKYYKNTFVQHKILDDILDKNNYLLYKDTHTFFNKKLRNTTLKSYFCLLIHSFVNISYKYKFDNLIKKIDIFIYKY
jgi:hypothetical protein